MPSIKVYTLGGLDKKSNDLSRPIDKASDMLNMEYDTQSTIKKRNGYNAVLCDYYSYMTADDLIYYNYADHILNFVNGLSAVGIWKRTVDGVGGEMWAGRSVSLPSGIGSMTNTSLSTCEVNNNLYFTNTDYNTYVMKYDGSNIYRAGLPTPRVGSALVGGKVQPDAYPSFTNSTTGYTRFFYSHKDINGNVQYSPIWQTPLLINPTSVISINSLKTDPLCSENGFLDKYCYIAKAGATAISSSQKTLITTRHNYVVGEKFLIDKENKAIDISPQGKQFIVLEVESLSTTTSANDTIHFTAASIGSYTISFLDMSGYTQYTTDYPLDIRTKLHIAISTTANSNYYVSERVIDNSLVLNSITMNNSEPVLVGGRPGPAINMADIYDDAYLKVMPPICKYIGSFGDQIIYGNIQSYFSTYNSSSVNAPNEKVYFANQSLITYSDKSTGDGPEGVSDLNFTKIGETWDGDITGVKRCNDSMIIFKNKGVFSIDGTIIDGQFSLRKINTNAVGCTSHKSILESEEGVYFQGHNGIFYTNGINVTKLTYELDPLFLSGTYLNTRSARMKKKQKSIFYTPDILSGTAKIIVIDYYYNQVYTWNFAHNPDYGIFEDKFGDIYFCSYDTDAGSKVMFKINNTYIDRTVAINASYSTTWHHAGEPALNKKWNSIRTWGLTSDAFTTTLTTEGDWQAGTALTTNQCIYGASTQTDFKMLDMQTKKALRFIFSNNTVNENMVITGYEITFEVFNSVDKN